MNVVSGQQQARTPGEREATPQLRTLVVCDLADSTDMVQRLGDRRAAELIRIHDRLARTVLARHDGLEIDKTDGFLLLFERPIRAVAFALDYQHALAQLSRDQGVALTSRVGIHVGDVVVWRNDEAAIARGAKPLEVEGLVKPVAARLAALARPGQILLSAVAAGFAQRAADELDTRKLRWKKHGAYRIKGLNEPLTVVEVGDHAIGPMKAPRAHHNARRVGHRTQVLWLTAILAILALAAGGYAWKRQQNNTQDISFDARDWVVVGDLQNHTGDQNLDIPVRSAFLLDLQQSRFVNVMPESEVRDTLAQMRKPRNTPVDRRIGSEVALRLHAKALVVPRIQNYESGFRVTAQLVNPETGKLVAQTSHLANNRNDIITAVDKLVLSLRRTLGESLDQIQTSSMPLAKATTNNINALRAFTLADQAQKRGDFTLASDMAKKALQIDPDFASAYALIGAVYVSEGRLQDARTAIDQAFKHIDRLTYLEQVRLQAMKTTIYDSPLDAISAWKVMADLYPDIAGGPNNVGLFLSGYSNDCVQAIPYLKHAASLPQAEQAASSHYVLGECYLSLGRTEEAVEHLKTASKYGFQGPFLALADAYVAQYDYSKAEDYLKSVKKDPVSAISLAQRHALIDVDQGRLAMAEKRLQSAFDNLTNADRLKDGWRIRLDLVAIQWARGDLDKARTLASKQIDELLGMKPQARRSLTINYNILLAMYTQWSARLGNVPQALNAVHEIEEEAQLNGFPVLQQLVLAAKAEIFLSKGNPKQALSTLKPVTSNQIWEVLDVRARASLAANSDSAIDTINKALQARGMAFGELIENNLGLAGRVVRWNIDHIVFAKAAAKMDPNASENALREFLHQWRNGDQNVPSLIEAHKIMRTFEQDSTRKKAPQAISIPTYGAVFNRH